MQPTNLVPSALLIAALTLAGCSGGPSLTGSFDRTLSVTAPIRLVLSNASGDVSITAGADNKVHVHDLHATILALLGFDHEKLTFRHSGRDFRLTDVQGRVVRDLIA